MPSSSEDRPQLYVHEWLAVVVIIGMLGLLTLFSLYGMHANGSLSQVNEGRHFLKPQFVEIFIDGAVNKPGSYKVKAGTSVHEAISLSEPKSHADLSKIKARAKVKNGQSIHVKCIPTIQITISGAVQQEGLIEIPKGTRLCELERFIKFNEDADLKKMSRKRILKSGEKIIVPAAIPEAVINQA